MVGVPAGGEETNMATVAIEGCTMHYQVFGESGPPLFLTPGGRMEKEVTRPLARRLADRCRVVIWDRRNCGASDVYINAGDPRSEQEIWADDVVTLSKVLGMSPAYFAGGSAGCRVTLLAAHRHLADVAGLTLFQASGGRSTAQNLGYTYHTPYIRAAEAGGMEAVCESDHFAERIRVNPKNRDILMSIDPEDFIKTMRRWNEAFYFKPEEPLCALSAQDLRNIAVPCLLTEGNDEGHPKEVSDRIAQLLPDVEYIKLPWTTQEWVDISNGRSSTTVARELYPRLADLFAEFIMRAEAKRQATTASPR
jgi:pimeloyl-ACP methyl ester carboxylesterase